MRSRQLTFVFADSPPGGKGAVPTDESVGKAFLLQIAKGKPTSDLIAPAADSSRLLEQAASGSNLAKAYVGEGYEVVVDLDLSKFFDRVYHERLLSRPAQRIADHRILTRPPAATKVVSCQLSVDGRRF